VTLADPPPERPAVNCSVVPDELLALQPVQLVSMELANGATEKAAFEEPAVTSPLPHPAANSSAGANSSERFLRDSRMVKIPKAILVTASRLCR
jgi:hypothetical protein